MMVLRRLCCCFLAAGVLVREASSLGGVPRRSAFRSFVAGVALPLPVWASGVSFEEAAKNAQKYRRPSECSPTNPSDCKDRYNKMLDPRKGLSSEELAKRDARNDEERAKLKAMLK
mmetsp:Transcript_24416/g.78863  ORF Transcript_24416/g.78863 Transcript_24416/m.78863 type:complete len:116 (+) Transcript_24416:126-473(+)